MNQRLTNVFLNPLQRLPAYWPCSVLYIPVAVKREGQELLCDGTLYSLVVTGRVRSIRQIAWVGDYTFCVSYNIWGGDILLRVIHGVHKKMNHGYCLTNMAMNLLKEYLICKVTSRYVTSTKLYLYDICEQRYRHKILKIWNIFKTPTQPQLNSNIIIINNNNNKIRFPNKNLWNKEIRYNIWKKKMINMRPHL